jgi:hypothetical protein
LTGVFSLAGVFDLSCFGVSLSLIYFIADFLALGLAATFSSSYSTNTY